METEIIKDKNNITLKHGDVISLSNELTFGSFKLYVIENATNDKKYFTFQNNIGFVELAKNFNSKLIEKVGYFDPELRKIIYLK
ncbi:MAG: hypothetical protein OEV44_00240 [Spirochaetota bacterium]|nr:hypothetical protein [Spirochaetota bacterium]